MSELRFSGTATLRGFPRDKSFGFELDGENRLIIKAGKEVFLIIEKESAVETVTPISAAIPEQPQLHGSTTVEEKKEEEKPKRTRTPSEKIDPQSIIHVAPLAMAGENPFKKLRAAYFDTIKTANGRTVEWWSNSTMVKNLEGNPTTFLRFFLDEKVIALGESASESTDPAPQQPAQTPGPNWANQFTPPSGNSSGGATFM